MFVDNYCKPKVALGDQILGLVMARWCDGKVLVRRVGGNYVLSSAGAHVIV